MSTAGDPQEGKINKQLASSPVVDVLGIVSARGVAGVGRNNEWTMIFGLSGWKTINGEFRESELTVRKPVLQDEINAEQIQSRDIVRITVRLAEESVLGSPQALLLGPIIRGRF